MNQSQPEDAPNPAAAARPSVTLAVVMRRLAAPSRWEDWRHEVVEVVVDDGQWGTAPRVLRDDGQERLTLFPGWPLALYADEGEGYYLNLTSGAPAWFVLWRIDDERPEEAAPVQLSVSYNEAGRWLDAQEKVDHFPMPEAARAWLQAYTDEHYRPEPKERRRPASFKAARERG